MISDPLLPASSPNSETRVRGETNGHADADQVREDPWASPVRAYCLRKQENLRVAWAAFHAGQAARHRRALEDLIRYHEQKAEALMTDEPKG
jgi:hypothetical protein